MGELKHVRVQLLDSNTGNYIEDVDVLSSADCIKFNDGQNLQQKFDSGVLSNKEVNDKILKNTLTYKKTSNRLTKLDNCIGEYVHNMQIRGRTLQNLIAETVNAIKEYSNFCFSDLLKPNTTYTLIVYNESDTEYKYYFNEYNFISSAPSTFKKGLNIVVNTTKNIVLNTTKNIVLKNYTGGNSAFTLKDFMLLEGDWTNKEIPEYFEGIKSVGELEGNKISILSHGKNLVNMLNIKDNSGLVKVNEKTKNKVVLEQIANRGYAQAHMDVHFKANTKYTLTGKILNENTCLRVYELDKDVNYAILTKTGSVTFTTSNDTKLQLLFYTSYELSESQGKIATFEDVIIEEGTTATSYEDYKADKTEILISSPHMGLPDGVSDIVDFDKNERIKNVQKAIFNGSQGNWSIINSTKSNTILFRISVPDLFIIANNYTLLNCICNKFALMTATDGWLSDTKEGICQDPSDRTLRFNVLKSRLETPDVAGFKKLLKTWADAGTPLEVYYQLAEHKIEKLNIKDELQTFENGYIQLDNAITPSTQLEYSTNLPSALSGVVEIQDKILDRVNILEKKKSITWDELEGV